VLPREGFPSSRSELASDEGSDDFALEPRDRSRRRQMLRAPLGAAHVGVAAMAARVARDRTQPLELGRVALVVHQRPGAVQCRGTQVAGIPGNDIAGAVAHPAANALDGSVGLNTEWQPASPETARTRSSLAAARSSFTSVQARFSAAGPR